MKSYLIVLDCTMDNVPVRLFNNRAEALEFARSMEPDPTETMDQLMGTDLTSGVCISLIVFDKSGVPIERELIRDLELEEHPRR